MEEMPKAHANGFANAVQCGAYARQTGKPCRQPAMANGRCRLHGGKSTGRPITTGKKTKAYLTQRKAVNDMLRESKKLTAYANECF